MSDLLEDLLKKIDYVKKNIYSEAKKSVLANEKLIFEMNLSQMQEQKDNTGGLLENKDRKFKGYYSQKTQLLSQKKRPLLPKIAGKPYNFVDSGDFKKGFKLTFNSNNQFTVSNYGLNSSFKFLFFKGYDNYLGLTKENEEKVNEIIQDNVLEFANKHL